MSVSDFDEKPDKKWGPMFKKVISNKIPHLTEKLQDALVSEEGIKNLISELIPKEVLGNLMGQVGSIREDLLDIFQRELRNRLDKIDPTIELEKILANFDVEVEAKFRLTPKTSSKATHESPKKKELENNYQNVLNFPLPKEKLIAVSKTFPFEDVEVLYSLGHRDFGENKVQDLALKAQAAKEAKLTDIRWHMIGHLQSNKVKKLLETPNLRSIHSVDSLGILQHLLSQRKCLKGQVGLFFEMNTSGEASKFGIPTYEELKTLVETFQDQETGLFFFQGLMTLGPHPDNPTKGARESFLALCEAKKKLKLDTLELSMGMSRDYPIALELGAHFIRIGTNIFGKRD